MRGETPNPGSDAAVALGCKCPVLDNWRGDPKLGEIRGFIVVMGCPVHAAGEVEHGSEA